MADPYNIPSLINSTNPPALTGAPAPGVGTVTGYNPAQGQAQAAPATSYDPEAFKVTPQQTTQSQLKDIIAAGSPLMQQAETSAREQMAQRGLINSSIGVTAGQQAVIAAAAPIAASDAATYAKAATDTTTARNTALQFGAASQNAASLQNAQLGTQTSLANAQAVNAAGTLQATAANTYAQQAQQIASAQSIAELQSATSKFIANLQSDTTLTAQQMQDETSKVLANIQSNTALTVQDKQNETAKFLADVNNASAQKIAQLNSDTTLTAQDKVNQSQQIIASMNNLNAQRIAQLQADTTLSAQDKQDETQLVIQQSNAALNTYLGQLQSSTQLSLSDKTAAANMALATVNNLSNQAIANINSSTQLSVEDKQTASAQIIANMNNQNAQIVQKMQNDGNLQNIYADGSIKTQIEQMSEQSAALRANSSAAAQMYNQGLAALATIVNNKDLNSDQKTQALNDVAQHINDGLAVIAQIAGTPVIQGTLNFSGGLGGGDTNTNTAATKTALTDVRGQLAAWGGADGVVQLIDSGASIDTIYAALNNARATTTNPVNTAILDPIIANARAALDAQKTAAPATATPNSDAFNQAVGQAPAPTPTPTPFSAPEENTGAMPLGGGIINTNPTTGTRQVWQQNPGGFGGHYITVPA